MSSHVIPPRTYLQVFAALIVLTVTTVALDLLARHNYVNLGHWQNEISLAIAVVKASLVILFFMHIWYSTRLTWVIALSSLLWLAILIGYTLIDYLTRSALPPVPGY